ncbi:YqiA/YcfP family alpha/beta fold hydrolase [Kaistella palustris]|uniref:YqiA/YcfP family alpha/beta fold hydrolase n=1 Tax=Kaistella palustris TaxID=493376 RepID=UPI0003F74520|nr:YqiA/YcfP family alpha/beta fold hydrolase [Kaistella palustris]
MKKKLLYIHGLGSDRNSRKFLNIKEYFGSQFEYNCLEWNDDSDIPSLLNEAEYWLNSGAPAQTVLIGDSTGANFACQLREKLKVKDIKSILVLTSPLLDIAKRTRDVEFPQKLISHLWTIEDPADALIIATRKDEVLDQTFLYENKFQNIELVDVDDTHQLLNFEKYVYHIANYIQSKSLKGPRA